MKTFLVGFLSLITMSGSALAEPSTAVLPMSVEVKEADPGLIQKQAEALMKSCRTMKERELKGQKIANTKISEKARLICFCIAKDVKRREDSREILFLTKYFNDKIDDDATLTDEQSMHLHELDKTEKNCQINPNYRYGMNEPRLPVDEDTNPKLNPPAVGNSALGTTKNSSPKQGVKAKKAHK